MSNCPSSLALVAPGDTRPRDGNADATLGVLYGSMARKVLGEE